MNTPLTKDDLADEVSIAMTRSWQLGQTYWQQADSENYSQQRKSVVTHSNFVKLQEETRALVLRVLADR
jgi:hypothetical protein